MTGRTLGRFHITARLGAGGLGEVYRARDTRLGRDVAIKVLPPAFTADPERIARFDREARLLASLSHPRIAAVHEVGSEEGVHFLVLELAWFFVQGGAILRWRTPHEHARLAKAV